MNDYKVFRMLLNEFNNGGYHHYDYNQYNCNYCNKKLRRKIVFAVQSDSINKGDTNGAPNAMLTCSDMCAELFIVNNNKP